MNPQERLESWKEIGAYLQRDATTARRWEKEEGLPVHRHNHKARSSVYAYPSEIDAWRSGRKVIPERARPRPLWKIPAFALTILLCLVMVGNGVRPVSAQQGRGIAERLLCEGVCADSEGNLSPDAKYLVKTDWDTGDLAVLSLPTGTSKRLMIKTESFAESSAYGENPVFSADMRQIVYHWSISKDGGAQLRITPNDSSGKWRILVNNPEFEYFEPEAWSPDGKLILVLIQKSDKTWQIAWVSASDGSMKQIVSLGWRIRGGRMRAALSPGGRYIAYAALAVNPPNATARVDLLADVHIYVVASDGSGGSEVVKTVGVNENPTWTPDGKYLLFASNRSGSLGLWSVGVQNGKAVGPPAVVRLDVGDIHTMGMRRDSLHYTVRQSAELISVAAMELRGESTETFAGVRPAWSPDGKSVAFKRHHPGGSDYDVVVHSLETGEERIYPTKLGQYGPGPTSWTHDGTGLIVGITRAGQDPNTPGVLCRIDVRRGTLQEIPNTDSAGSRAMSPDDKTIYFVSRVKRGEANADSIFGIFAKDLAGGPARLVFASPKPGALAFILSPDGRSFLLTSQKQDVGLVLARVSAEGTDYREIYAGKRISYPVWTPDARSVLFGKWDTDDKTRIWRMPAEGGTPELTGLEFPGRFQSLDLSPDGTRLAFSFSQAVEELRALDNIPAGLK